MIFHEENPTPTKLSNTLLKIQFNEQTPTTKRDTPKEVTFLLNDNPTPAKEKQSTQLSPYIHQISSTEGRGWFEGRGGYGIGDRGISLYQHSNVIVSSQHPWEDEVKNLLQELRIYIIREVQTIITNAVILQIITQIKDAINTALSPGVSKIRTLTPYDPYDDIYLITQSPMKENDIIQSTPMEVDTKPRKRKEPMTSEENFISPSATQTRQFWA